MSDDPARADRATGAAAAVCAACGSSVYRDGRCIACATIRMHDQHRQMSQRCGPEYDKAVNRSRAGAAAWRAAGSPVKVTLVTVGSHDADGNYRGEQKWILAATLRRGEHVEATPEQVDAWYVWRNSRP